MHFVRRIEIGIVSVTEVKSPTLLKPISKLSEPIPVSIKVLLVP